MSYLLGIAPRRLFWCLVLALLLTSLASAERLPLHVVIVSVDGLRPDALGRGHSPVLDRLARTGSATFTARTVLPSVTLVSHASMLTGVPPSIHKVTWNTEKPKGTLQAPTIFMLAADQGVSNVLIAGKKRFAHLVPDPARTPLVFGGWGGAKTVRKAVEVLSAQRPRLALVHLTDPDDAGHKHGWMSPRYLEGVRRADTAVGELLVGLDRAGLSGRTVLILTADHGGHGHRHGDDSDDDVLIPWIASGPGVRKGHAIRAAVGTCDTAATALWLLELRVPANFTGRAVREAFEESATSGTR